ncbi:uncharacterized protein L3040_008254 [Drepanopeziza brunnea f. sp. 'multigermtubi']|uniref:Alpha-ketoglutarate-dependent dioxygenase AlkB-like domain-containing protein n=1 Tax=Marssonina brunnea f. sp. multigermtubi (strain MB_m1) TaxID=1072389 RepID=K1WN91_MARBU|nr:uncharacterized protein MBM_07616 [Drepanopeziza brunnea f. sp. 'multigermtubi' MB_m1]EKD14386.1 hypothetical protein MBM_07616 [Drepanopeziza brunnea f. sp. 'multigermtubi' MB_m1]KAJ5034989.1 hypothetical protein L3040_008254 [Drepanopeziza brunnea f. sp. 'multigermtubi']
MDTQYFSDMSEVLNSDLPSKSFLRTPERSLMVKLKFGEPNKLKLAYILATQCDSRNLVEHSLGDAEHEIALLVTPPPESSESRQSLKRGAEGFGLLDYGFTKKRIVADDDDEQADNKADTAPAIKVNVPKAKFSKTKVPKVKVKVKSKAIKIAPADRNLTLDKPEPFGQPPIWSDKRQALCEALPYYRAYQAGAYSTNNIVYGLLCDKGVYARDHIDDHVVICSVGGGKKADDETGEMSLGGGHKVDHNIATYFRRSMDGQQAVAIIIGQGNTNCPVKLDHCYNVMDMFHVTDVWYDRYEKKCWMVRLEKIDLDVRSWWSPKSQPTAQQDPTIRAVVQTCDTCNQPSKQIYSQGWTCTNPHCKDHFNFGIGFDHKTLEYSQAFLQERHPFQATVPNLVPALPWNLPAQSAVIKKGMVCPVCRCCSRRLHWNFWQCENPECDFKQDAVQQILTVSAASTSVKTISEVMAGGIISVQFSLGAHRPRNTLYLIPDEARKTVGFVAVLKSSSAVNARAGGPDDLFAQLQMAEIQMKRNPARQRGAPGETVTSHFGRNYGATYKFGVPQESTSFSDAPDVMLEILARTSWASQQAIAYATQTVDENDFKAWTPPNELLCLGYGTNCKIGYHDDGEKTLGPTVTSLSLGCPASMSFRPKAKTSMGSSKNQTGTKPDCLKFTLEHGDIMVMHGPKIQQLYEHSVTPFGPLRFALTSRTILFDMIGVNDGRDIAIKNGQIPRRAERFQYDGQ